MAVVSYKCPNCGGPLTFNPDKQMFSCDYCLSDFSEQQLIDHYKKLDEELKNNQPDPVAQPVPVENTADDTTGQNDTANNNEENSVIYTCPSCGAEVITTESTAATECYYCHNPVVIGGRLSGELLPDKVIPFKISKEKAVQDFEQMCKKKKFLPRGFFSKKQIEKMSGVYFPYWYVDSTDEINADATGETVRTWVVGKKQYTETKKYAVRRSGLTNINDLFYGALSKEDQMMLQSVHPYDTKENKKFSMTYLSGFQAEKRDVKKESLYEKATQDCERYARQLVTETGSEYSSFRIDRFSMQNKNNLWEYTLLPVWIITYNFGGKIYPYAMNGQTGKMYGSLPVSLKRLAVCAGIIAGAVALLGTIGGLLLL